MDPHEDQRVPTLYDFVLASEKMAAEIRKQNKEIKILTALLQEQNERELAKKEDISLIKTTLQMVDSSFCLSEAIQKTSAAIIATLPSGIWFFNSQKKEWKSRVESLLASLIEGVRLIQVKNQAVLEDLNVEMISPFVGEEFSPGIHKAVEQLSGKPGSILKVLQRGYRYKGKILRYAQVAIGIETKENS
jgi:molecular chaperone GrpE